MNETALESSLAVLIPCYNCGAAVKNVVEQCRIIAQVVLTINDGSTDQTAEILRQCPSDTIGWEKNRGKGTAMLEGMRYLLQRDNWSLLATLDSDGQHDPTDLPGFLKMYQQTQADLILGRRDFNTPEIPPIRRHSNLLSSKWIGQLTGCHLADLQCGYRLFTRRAVELLVPCIHSARYAVETEMVLEAHRLGLRMVEMDIRCIYTPEANHRSSWRPLLDSWHIAKVVLQHLVSRRQT